MLCNFVWKILTCLLMILHRIWSLWIGYSSWSGFYQNALFGLQMSSGSLDFCPLILGILQHHVGDSSLNFRVLDLIIWWPGWILTPNLTSWTLILLLSSWFDFIGLDLALIWLHGLWFDFVDPMYGPVFWISIFYVPTMVSRKLHKFWNTTESDLRVVFPLLQRDSEVTKIWAFFRLWIAFAIANFKALKINQLHCNKFTKSTRRS